MRPANDTDRVFYADIDEELCSIDPWGDAEEGKFIGKIVIDELLSTSDDVAVYNFDVESIVDDFIDSNSPFNIHSNDEFKRVYQ